MNPFLPTPLLIKTKLLIGLQGEREDSLHWLWVWFAALYKKIFMDRFLEGWVKSYCKKLPNTTQFLCCDTPTIIKLKECCSRKGSQTPLSPTFSFCRQGNWDLDSFNEWAQREIAWRVWRSGTQCSIPSEFPWREYNHEYKLCFDLNFNHMSQSQVQHLTGSCPHSCWSI